MTGADLGVVYRSFFYTHTHTHTRTHTPEEHIALEKLTSPKKCVHAY